MRGTLYSSIVEADWIAEDYDAAGLCTVPSKVYVEIRDEKGTFINEPKQPDELVDVATNRAKDAEVLGVTGENAGETGSMLFDGSYSPSGAPAQPAAGLPLSRKSLCRWAAG